MKKLFVLLTIMLSLAIVPAHAQIGKNIGRVISRGVERGAERAAEKVAEKEAERISKKIEEQAEKSAAALDSLGQAAIEANDALNEEQEQLEAEEQTAKNKNAGKKTQKQSGTDYSAINAERKAANAKLKYDDWDK
ncbi:MAG: hypothetical protein IJ057_07635 [Bacteroidales bacterium]|nr:hypothetical protein [Bacteroidales bacterium]